jgi:hypothetical protein
MFLISAQYNMYTLSQFDKKNIRIFSARSLLIFNCVSNKHVDPKSQSEKENRRSIILKLCVYSNLEDVFEIL